MRRYDVKSAGLAVNDWRVSEIASTQIFAQKMIADGYVGLCMQSYTKGSTIMDLNMALWKWCIALPSKLVVNAGEGRLGQKT